MIDLLKLSRIRFEKRTFRLLAIRDLLQRSYSASSDVDIETSQHNNFDRWAEILESSILENAYGHVTTIVSQEILSYIIS